MNQGVPAVATTFSSPPRAPLAFRVGVVGHRPNRLDGGKLGELAATISLILKTVKEETHAVGRERRELYDGACPVMRVVSPLAEGTDRIFAEQALELGFELCAVLPFPKAEFEKDFAEGTALETDSLNRFQRLLAKAATRFELDGTRAEDGEAYGQGGLVVLNQSDLLIVVWDGERQGKRGGTEDTLDQARKRGVAIAWIDAKDPKNWQLLDAATPLPMVVSGQRIIPNRSGTQGAIRALVHEVLELPRPPQDTISKSDDERIDPESSLKIFYRETRPPFTVAVFWRVFQSVVAEAKWPGVDFRVKDFEAGVMKEWPRADDRPSPDDPPTSIAGLIDRLRPFYAWPDKLAVLYAARYRSAFSFNYLTAAAAVGLALSPLAIGPHPPRAWEVFCYGSELLAISLVLSLVLVGRRKHWHERWLDYRMTAELVRHLRMVAPLGGRRPFPQVPAHWATYGQPGASWMNWYVQAVERWLGLPSVVIDKAYLVKYLAHLISLVEEQFDYHETVVRRCHVMERRLHRASIGLLFSTLVACLFHLVVGIKGESSGPGWLPLFLASIGGLLTVISGFFPALGAGLAAIVNQGEFRSLAKRSEAMSQQLDRLKKQIVSLHEEIANTADSATKQYSNRADALASNTAGLLINEVLDWRVVLLDQPLLPPG
jgi:hypothetical protein